MDLVRDIARACSPPCNPSISRTSRTIEGYCGIIETAPLYGLRYSFAKALTIGASVSLEKVATLLGHSNIDTTRIYTTPGEEDLADAVGKHMD